MIKRIIITTLILCNVSSAHSQDCCDRLEERAVLIESLRKVIIQHEAYRDQTQIDLKTMQDNIKLLESDLSSLEKIKSERKSLADLLKTKSDSIALLKTQLSDKDKQITTARQQGDQFARAQYEHGKSEALAPIILSYKKPFDDLIKSSSKESVKRDIPLIGNNPEVTPILNDLQIYFNTLELLSNKFDLAQIRNAQTQLNQIQQESILLDNLKDKIGNYQIFNEGLKETLNELIALDRRESVTGMPVEVRNMKHNKILSELSPYFFNFDYNYTDYPYLSNILLEILKLKQPDPDAIVTDLLEKL